MLYLNRCQIQKVYLPTINIPKFFNYLGKDTRMDTDVFGGNFKKDFEKYKGLQAKIDNWMADNPGGM